MRSGGDADPGPTGWLKASSTRLKVTASLNPTPVSKPRTSDSTRSRRPRGAVVTGIARFSGIWW